MHEHCYGFWYVLPDHPPKGEPKEKPTGLLEHETRRGVGNQLNGAILILQEEIGTESSHWLQDPKQVSYRAKIKLRPLDYRAPLTSLCQCILSLPSQSFSWR